MSTRSWIAKQIGEDEYQIIYCHFDGYLTNNGAILLDHYNTPEKVDELLALGDISSLGAKLNPDPEKTYESILSKLNDGVTVAYARDYGEKISSPRIYSMDDLVHGLSDEYLYVFTLQNEWKYSHEWNPRNLQDVKEDLEERYAKYGMERPEGYYGMVNRRVAIQLSEQQGDGDAESQVPEEQESDGFTPSM